MQYYTLNISNMSYHNQLMSVDGKFLKPHDTFHTHTCSIQYIVMRQNIFVIFFYPFLKREKICVF